MNYPLAVEPQGRAKGRRARELTTLSYIQLGKPSDGGLDARSDAGGIFEANLTPPDELWNRPKVLQDVVRSSQYDLDMGRDVASAVLHHELPTAFVRARKSAVAGLVKSSRRLEPRASTPIGIWKGVIKSIDPEQRMFSAELVPLRGSDVQVSGEISFDQINEEDYSMVQPGAVFYVEQYARTARRQVSSDTIVRFRRGNAWTEEQIRKVSELAAGLANLMGDGRSGMKIAD